MSVIHTFSVIIITYGPVHQITEVDAGEAVILHSPRRTFHPNGISVFPNSLEFSSSSYSTRSETRCEGGRGWRYTRSASVNCTALISRQDPLKSLCLHGLPRARCRMSLWSFSWAREPQVQVLWHPTTHRGISIRELWFVMPPHPSKCFRTHHSAYRRCTGMSRQFPHLRPSHCGAPSLPRESELDPKSYCLSRTGVFSAKTPRVARAFRVKFEINSHTYSSLKVDQLKMTGEMYKPFKGVRGMSTGDIEWRW